MNANSELYTGIYDVPEAARIIRTTSKFLETPYLVNNRHVLRWIRKGLSLPTRVDTPGRDLVISFADLISMRVVALLRISGRTWRQIYTSERTVKELTGSPRPFATQQFWTGLREIYTRLEGQLIAASMSGQGAFLELVEQHLVPVAGLTFDEVGVANSWTPLPMDGVIMRPNVQFGAPCIKGTRITTNTIWEMHEGGDSVDFIARVYELEREQVDEAIEWESRLAAA